MHEVKNLNKNDTYMYNGLNYVYNADCKFSNYNLIYYYNFVLLQLRIII